MDQRVFFDYGLTFVQPIPMRTPGLALVVVDMQYHDAAAGVGFCRALDVIAPGSCDYFNDRNERVTVPAIATLIAGCRARTIPIIYLCLGSEHQDLRDLPPRMRAWIRDVEQRSGEQDLFWRSNPLYAIRSELAPEPGDLIVHKTTFGAFNSSNLDELLRAAGVDRLIITGISTNCCVETTARDAADRGYGVVICADATADYDEPAQDAALRAFHFNFGRVVASPTQLIAAIDAAAMI
jgi:biuret amidohydrolase